MKNIEARDLILDTAVTLYVFSATARFAERSCFSNLHVPCPWGASLKLDVGPPEQEFLLKSLNALARGVLLKKNFA